MQGLHPSKAPRAPPQVSLATPSALPHSLHGLLPPPHPRALRLPEPLPLLPSAGSISVTMLSCNATSSETSLTLLPHTYLLLPWDPLTSLIYVGPPGMCDPQKQDRGVLLTSGGASIHGYLIRLEWKHG